MPLIFFTPTINRFSECNNLLRSVQSSSLVPDKIIVLDNSGGKFTTTLNNIEIHRSKDNIGVAKSFNYALYYAMTNYPNHYLIISNDDLTLRNDTIELLSIGIDRNPDELIYCTDKMGINAFSLFACHPATLTREVGYFETAYFSYLEDSDLAYRLRLIGKDICFIKDCLIDTHIGSATIKAFTPEQETRFHAMRNRGMAEYVSKWGALPEKGERFTTPYNSGIDAVSWHREKFTHTLPY